MKLRLGFVTNSSSTNYTLVWRGKPGDLPALIENWKSYLQELYNKAYVLEDLRDDEDEDSVPTLDEILTDMVDKFSFQSWNSKEADAPIYLEDFDISISSIYGQDNSVDQVFNHGWITKAFTANIHCKDIQGTYIPE